MRFLFPLLSFFTLNLNPCEIKSCKRKKKKKLAFLSLKRVFVVKGVCEEEEKKSHSLKMSVSFFRPHLAARFAPLSSPLFRRSRDSSRGRGGSINRLFCSSRSMREVPFVPESEPELRNWLVRRGMAIEKEISRCSLLLSLSLSSSLPTHPPQSFQSSRGVDPSQFGTLPGSKTTADLFLEVERGESELFEVFGSGEELPPAAALAPAPPLPTPASVPSTALRRVRVALVRVTRRPDRALLREVWQRLPPDGRQRSRSTGAGPFSSSSNWPAAAFSSSVSEKVARGESFAEAAARGLAEELGIGEGGAAVVAVEDRAASEGQDDGGGGESGASSSASPPPSSSSSAFSYPGLPCSYETRLFVAEVDGKLLPSEEFFEREEETARGTLVTRWQWVKKSEREKKNELKKKKTCPCPLSLSVCALSSRLSLLLSLRA